MFCFLLPWALYGDIFLNASSRFQSLPDLHLSAVSNDGGFPSLLTAQISDFLLLPPVAHVGLSSIISLYVDLPCHLSPNISAESMEVRWYRNKISPAVYVYQKEKDQKGEQIKEYQGRTTFVRDNITEGNVAVTIHNVRASDDGQYRCFFKDDQIYEEAIIELKVAIQRNELSIDVTLDPDTAHPHLFLYEGLKSIRLEDTRQKLPDKPERFDSWPCVLGREGFTSGKHYWEVEVGDRTDWAIGVCKENVTKKGFDPMNPENGFWAVELYGNGYWALTPLRTPLPLTGPPRCIGVFLDYESGHISFYDITNGSHIYTFPQASFSGTLRPFFCLWSCGKKPLTICPIFNGPDEVTVIANAPVPSKENLVAPTSERSTPGDADILQRSNSKLFPIQPNNGALDH
uniref:Butyrophilin subfamily 1 member A1 n=1 Tax=Vombatus ursinus TaxID=29139 RepID=A0A4X2K9M0_VOMUR